MNGGNLTVEVGQGDTDPIDSNGNITVTGGTIKMTGQTGFDFDGTATYTGGDIYFNGENKLRLSIRCLVEVDLKGMVVLAVVPLVDDHKRKSPFSKEKGDFLMLLGRERIILRLFLKMFFYARYCTFDSFFCIFSNFFCF